jgi:hypothetical protein
LQEAWTANSFHSTLCPVARVLDDPIIKALLGIIREWQQANLPNNKTIQNQYQ